MSKKESDQDDCSYQDKSYDKQTRPIRINSDRSSQPIEKKSTRLHRESKKDSANVKNLISVKINSKPHVYVSDSSNSSDVLIVRDEVTNNKSNKQENPENEEIPSKDIQPSNFIKLKRTSLDKSKKIFDETIYKLSEDDYNLRINKLRDLITQNKKRAVMHEAVIIDRTKLERKPQNESYANIISEKSNKLFSGRKQNNETSFNPKQYYLNIIERPAQNIQEFYEECLNPTLPLYSKAADYSVIPFESKFSSYKNYLDYFNVLRSNENKASILDSLLEKSEIYPCEVYSIDLTLMLKMKNLNIENNDLLFLDNSYKNLSHTRKPNDIKDCSFLGVVLKTSLIDTTKNDIVVELIISKVLSDKVRLMKGQKMYFKGAGSIITSLREFLALSNINKSKVIKHLLWPSFEEDFAHSKINWDSKSEEIKILNGENQREYNVTFNESMKSIENVFVRSLSDTLMKFHLLNISQANAVARSVKTKEKFFLIQGPPGTGKTKTILSICSCFLLIRTEDADLCPNVLTLPSKKSIKILICAPSNTAVDLIVLKLSKGLLNLKGERFTVNFLRIGYGAGSNTNKFTLDYLVGADQGKFKMRVRAEMVENAQIICTTLSSAASDSLLDSKFDLIIIDEACQSIEFSTLIPLQFNPSKIILVGDPCQLPPTIISKQKLLEKSLFERMLIYHKPAVLNMQYRMNPAICKLSSLFFYDSLIETAQNIYQIKIQNGSIPFKSKVSPVNFIAVTDKNEMMDEYKSFFNLAESDLCVKICKKINERYKGKIKIAILSPYKAQVNVLKKRRELKGHNIEINTIDSFQGREADIVILSTVRQTRLGFTTDFRRINVAITRSRECLIILGNVCCLQKNELWKSIISYIEKNHKVYNEKDIQSFINKI